MGRRMETGVIAVLGRLDLEHLGAHVTQKHAADRPGDVVSEFENLDSLEWFCHRSSSS